MLILQVAKNMYTMEFPKLKAVFFDMDGTLIDSEMFYFRAWVDVLKRFGLHFTAEEWLEQMAGQTTQQVYGLLETVYGLQEPWESFLQQVKDAVVLQYQVDRVDLMPGVVELLEDLRARGIRMAVVTSSFQHVAIRHLQSLGILDFFEFLITRDDVENPKPHPEPYLKALLKMGVTCEEAVALEDSVPGTQSVRDAGLYCIAVQPHPKLRAQLQADRVVESLMEFQRSSVLSC